ncbi:uncharacterized protein [Chelonus insularis]|uniref:uncharacterized protein n=1 Tax=Chelonus insularis TaxID=460826 RepID=UPI00158C5B50|nr:uncharacterized protein LOC118068431 [Chelonus insularis]
MKPTIILLFIISFVVIHSANAGFRPRSSYSYKESPSKTASKSSSMMLNDGRNERASNAAQTETIGKKASRGVGISAWGIIGIILAAILIATTGYYAFVFYPFLCKKERNYDMIELTNV